LRFQQRLVAFLVHEVSQLSNQTLVQVEILEDVLERLYNFTVGQLNKNKFVLLVLWQIWFVLHFHTCLYIVININQQARQT
jgi:hypothetical protein